MVQDGPGWSRMVQDGPGWSRMVQDGPRWSRMVQDGPGWSQDGLRMVSVLLPIQHDHRRDVRLQQRPGTALSQSERDELLQVRQ